VRFFLLGALMEPAGRVDNETVGTLLIVQVSTILHTILDGKGFFCDDALKLSVTRKIVDHYAKENRLATLHERVQDPCSASWVKQWVEKVLAVPGMSPRPRPPDMVRTRSAELKAAASNKPPSPITRSISKELAGGGGNPFGVGTCNPEPGLQSAAAPPRRKRVMPHGGSNEQPGASETLAWELLAEARGSGQPASKMVKLGRARLDLTHYKNSLLVTGHTRDAHEFLKHGVGKFGVGLAWNPQLKGWLCPFKKRDNVIKAFDSRKDIIEYTINYYESEETPALPHPQPARRPSLWETLAGPLLTESHVKKFFQERQASAGAVGPNLRLGKVVKIENERALKAFVTAGGVQADPLDAHRQGVDAFLFHGCPQVAAPNIEAEGLRLSFAAHGMLGRGLYGAPDPRKSKGYAHDNQNGTFMFICRFNLSTAKHAGPQTKHRNDVFDEFCIFDDKQVVVLWMLKLA